MGRLLTALHPHCGACVVAIAPRNDTGNQNALESRERFAFMYDQLFLQDLLHPLQMIAVFLLKDGGDQGEH
jgi:hypothetical protein